ncbi:unnamed protein product [Calypogeia fissa]
MRITLHSKVGLLSTLSVPYAEGQEMEELSVSDIELYRVNCSNFSRLKGTALNCLEEISTVPCLTDFQGHSINKHVLTTICRQLHYT